MAELKLTISNKDGKSYLKKLEDSSLLLGRKLGESINGDLIGLTGYELKILGGSDSSGFPMRPGLETSGKKKIFARGGVGIKPRFKGNYIRKSVAGNTISPRTAQVNLSVLKEGKKSLVDLFGKKEEAKEPSQ